MSRYGYIIVVLLIIGAVLSWNEYVRDGFWQQYSNERFGYTVLVPHNTLNFSADDFMFTGNNDGNAYDYRWFSDYSTWEKQVDFGNVSCYEALPNVKSLPMLGIDADVSDEVSTESLSLKEFTDLVYSEVRPTDIVESLTSTQFLDNESFVFTFRKSGTFSQAVHKYIFTENQSGDTCIIEYPLSDHATDYEKVPELRQEWIESFVWTDISN